MEEKTGRLRKRTKLFYGIGDLGNAVVNSAIQFFLMKFYTDGALIVPALAGNALLIGSDTPSLSHQDLHDALVALKNGCECVLNPAEDGGYVLIGLRRADAALFHNITWGSDTVLKTTRLRLQQQGVQWCELKTHRDIDRPEDLRLCHLP